MDNVIIINEDLACYSGKDYVVLCSQPTIMFRCRKLLDPSVCTRGPNHCRDRCPPSCEGFSRPVLYMIGDLCMDRRLLWNNCMNHPISSSERVSAT